ncbi:MAG TPA: hypothetical protein DCL81_07435 [Algoriphagus sp.]|nr:hypothetical protein [Algoriphagus sp.]
MQVCEPFLLTRQPYKLTRLFFYHVLMLFPLLLLIIVTFYFIYFIYRCGKIVLCYLTIIQCIQNFVQVWVF